MSEIVKGFELRKFEGGSSQKSHPVLVLFWSSKTVLKAIKIQSPFWAGVMLVARAAGLGSVAHDTGVVEVQ